jgi:hypothetical protein
MNTTTIHATTLLHESRTAYILWDEDSQSIIIRKKSDGIHPEAELLDVPVVPTALHSTDKHSYVNDEWQGVLGTFKAIFNAPSSSN